MEEKGLKHIGYVIFRNHIFTLKDGEKVKSSMELEDFNKKIYHTHSSVVEAINSYKQNVPNCDWDYKAVYINIDSRVLLPMDK